MDQDPAAPDGLGAVPDERPKRGDEFLERGPGVRVDLEKIFVRFSGHGNGPVLDSG